VSRRPPGEELFEFVVYLVSCARLSLDEPPVYGSFRLIEGASRLIEAARGWGIDVDETLARARESIEGNKLLMIDERGAYERWLTGLLAELSAEAAERNLKLPE
jgi:hypothetical protein